MKLIHVRVQLLIAALLLSPSLNAADATNASTVCADCIRKNLAYLAGPDLHGRGSGTEDEHHAAQYIADQLKSYGLKPGAETGQYIQMGSINSRQITGTPTLTYTRSQQPVTLTQGKELGLVSVQQPDASAPLQKLDLSDPTIAPAVVKAGAAVLLKLTPGTRVERVAAGYFSTRAAMLILAVPGDKDESFDRVVKHGPRPDRNLGGTRSGGMDVMLLAHAAAEQMWALPEGTPIKLHAEVSPWTTTHTWNVLARIEGKKADQQIILLSAHLDHLGVRDGKMYPGADDDASGTVAVMELARALAKEPQPQRTVVVALFGSEEAGLLGARYFLEHPTFPLKNIVANLNFEMIARPDSAVKPGQLWMTGWERTNLGPQLALHGAQLVGDPHPDQNFFMRSDNFALAKDGIVAQSISSYGLHSDYHQPTDTLDKVDWNHLDSAVGSMIAPVNWLANSDFIPQWNAGGRP